MIGASFLRERILKSNPENNQKYKSKSESKISLRIRIAAPDHDLFLLHFLDIPHPRD
jgi:hypothetical protein